MSNDRLNWFAVFAALIACLGVDAAILGVLVLVSDFKTAILIFGVGGGPVTLFAVGPVYTWFKARGGRTR